MVETKDNLVGQVFGRWLVDEFLEDSNDSSAAS